VVLTGLGVEVISVGLAGEALAEMKRQRCDVLISDIELPEMDGDALVSKNTSALSRARGQNSSRGPNGIRRS